MLIRSDAAYLCWLPVTTVRTDSCRTLFTDRVDLASCLSRPTLWDRIVRHFLLIVSVAGFALARSRFIEHDALPVHSTREFVTIGAGHVLVSALQRKSCAGVVVEICRLPPTRIVAAGTVGNVLTRAELSPVRILVASRA